MEKRGLSPLIATVLLIGITISLAALVMVWGQQLFKQTTEETSRSAQGEITCISKIEVNILNASCEDDALNPAGPGNSGRIDIIVDNKNEEPVHGLIVRLYGLGGPKTIQLSAAGSYPFPLDAFNTITYTLDYTTTPLVLTQLTKVEVIPQIRLDDGSLKACAQKIDSFTLIPHTAAGGCQ
mgnify:CR=1 FL=1